VIKNIYTAISAEVPSSALCGSSNSRRIFLSTRLVCRLASLSRHPCFFFATEANCGSLRREDRDFRRGFRRRKSRGRATIAARITQSRVPRSQRGFHRGDRGAGWWLSRRGLFRLRILRRGTDVSCQMKWWPRRGSVWPLRRNALQLPSVACWFPCAGGKPAPFVEPA